MEKVCKMINCGFIKEIDRSKEPNKWKEHLMDYLGKFMDYRYHKLNEILRKGN